MIERIHKQDRDNTSIVIVVYAFRNESATPLDGCVAGVSTSVPPVSGANFPRPTHIECPLPTNSTSH